MIFGSAGASPSQYYAGAEPTRPDDFSFKTPTAFPGIPG